MRGPSFSLGSSELAQGWKVIAVAALGGGFGVSPVPFYTIGVFTKPLGADLGWSRAEVQMNLTFITLGVLLGSPIIGWVTDRFGVKRAILFSTAAFAVGLAALGLATQNLATFYAISFLIGLLSVGTTSITWSRVIFDRFRKQQGFALGLTLMGSGLTATCAPAYATWLVSLSGWRLAYVGLAILPGLIALPLATALLWSTPTKSAAAAGQPADTARGALPSQAFRSPKFWVIGGGFFLVILGTGGLSPHIVPMLTDGGYSPQAAAGMMGSLGLAVLAGRFVTGYLLDRVWVPALAAVELSLPALSCLVLSRGVGHPWLTAAAVFVVGFASGAEFDLIPYCAARYFGMRRFGTIYAAIYTMTSSAAGLGPPLYGWAFDKTGSYTLILEITAGCFAAGAAVLLLLGPYPSAYRESNEPELCTQPPSPLTG